MAADDKGIAARDAASLRQEKAAHPARVSGLPARGGSVRNAAV
jgi:hypothetical protein